jgi:ubiquinone/menaquinone biosynthesis C-methylase UbiE
MTRSRVSRPEDTRAATEPAEPSAFHAFERVGWERIPRAYQDAFGTLTTQAIDPLLDAAHVGPRVRVLDVATGPGYVAGAAARRGASVVGVDFSAAMLAEARRHHPAIAFEAADAAALPFPDASFDAVVMSFGLLHLDRPDQALAEAYRVLRVSGRVAFTVWAKPQIAIGFGIVLGAIQQHGRLDVPLPPGPPFFRFSDPDECRRTLLAVGFRTPEARTIPQVWRLASPDALFEVMRDGTVRTAGLLRAQTPDAREAIRVAIREAVRPYERGGGVELPMPAVLATAARP